VRFRGFSNCCRWFRHVARGPLRHRARTDSLARSINRVRGDLGALARLGRARGKPSRRAWRSGCGFWQLRPCWCSPWADAGSPHSTSRRRSRTRPRSGPRGRRSERRASTLRGRGWSGAGSFGSAPRPPTPFPNAGAMTTASARAGAAASAMAALRRKPLANSRAHGSSRWATTAEMKRAGLLQGAGVVLCQTDDAEFRTTLDSAGRTRTRCTRLGALVRHDGPEHVFCFAPTRSGKGVGLVIPTLLSWPQSVLVYDIKKENWALTAGWRRQFSRTW